MVTFSGDKLMGGPQAGILCGQEPLIAQVKANALYRALRPGKMSLAALEGTLEAFVAGRAREEIPTLKMLCAAPDEILERAKAMASKLPAESLTAELLQGFSRVGGGSAPIHEIPTWVISIKPGGVSAEVFSERLRLAPGAVVARVKEGRVLLDLRTVMVDQEEELLSAIRHALENSSS
jgi:L-seryl-tRNA(Ser) seleniumtransferase